MSIEQSPADILLSHPDYVGSWGDIEPGKHTLVGANRGEFHLYILTSYPESSLGRLSRIPADELRGIKRVEGIILDRVGLSVFSGTFGRDMVEFTKRYSQAAIRNGGFDEIDYQGKVDQENGSVSGQYSIPGMIGRLEGGFEMRPLRDKLKNSTV